MGGYVPAVRRGLSKGWGPEGALEVCTRESVGFQMGASCGGYAMVRACSRGAMCGGRGMSGAVMVLNKTIKI